MAARHTVPEALDLFFQKEADGDLEEDMWELEGREQSFDYRPSDEDDSEESTRCDSSQEKQHHLSHTPASAAM